MSTHPCVHLFVFSPDHYEKLSGLYEAEDKALDDVCHGTGSDQQWERATEVSREETARLAVRETQCRMPLSDALLTDFVESLAARRLIPEGFPESLFRPEEVELLWRALTSREEALGGHEAAVRELTKSHYSKNDVGRFYGELRETLREARGSCLAIRTTDGVWDSYDSDADDDEEEDDEHDVAHFDERNAELLANLRRVQAESLGKQSDERAPKGSDYDRVGVLLDVADATADTESPWWKRILGG